MHACNFLGEHIESKSKLEKELLMWRDKLVKIAKDEKQLSTTNTKLIQDIERIRDLLAKDNKKREELKQYQEKRIKCRDDVQKNIDKLRDQLRLVDKDEQKRLEGFLMDLASAHKKLLWNDHKK